MSVERSGPAVCNDSNNNMEGKGKMTKFVEL